MPAKSKSQQRFMGMVRQCQKTGDCASKEVKKTANSMKSGDVKKYASTKRKGLPDKVSEKIITFKDFILNEDQDAEFKKFMQLVDNILEGTLGLGHDHFEDWMWYSAFEDNYTPQEAVDAFMEETGMDMY